MVPVSDFSGFVSSICALANAVASAAIDGLDRCMARLLSRGGQKIEADRAGFGALGADAMADRFFGILRHEALELCPRLFVVEMRRAGPGKDAGKLGPGIGRGHIDDADGFEPQPRRLDTKQLRLLTTFDAAPELALGGDNEMLIERIGMGEDLD